MLANNESICSTRRYKLYIKIAFMGFILLCLFYFFKPHTGIVISNGVDKIDDKYQGYFIVNNIKCLTDMHKNDKRAEAEINYRYEVGDRVNYFYYFNSCYVDNADYIFYMGLIVIIVLGIFLMYYALRYDYKTSKEIDQIISGDAVITLTSIKSEI